MRESKVSSDKVELRSDHLLAVVNYALEQAENSGIEVLEWGDNENALSYSEQLDYIKEMQQHLQQLVASGNCDLLVEKA